MAYSDFSGRFEPIILIVWLACGMAASQIFWPHVFGDGFVAPAWDYAVIAYGAYFMQRRLPAPFFLLAGLAKDIYVGFPIGISMLCYFLLYLTLRFVSEEARPGRYIGWQRHIGAGLVCVCTLETALLAATAGNTSLYDFFFYAAGTCLCYAVVHYAMQRGAEDLAQKYEKEKERREIEGPKHG